MADGKSDTSKNKTGKKSPARKKAAASGSKAKSPAKKPASRKKPASKKKRAPAKTASGKKGSAARAKRSGSKSTAVPKASTALPKAKPREKPSESVQDSGERGTGKDRTAKASGPAGLSPGHVTPPSGKPPAAANAPQALTLSITDDFLNDISLLGLADGIPLQTVEQEVTLPAMGEVTLSLSLTVTGLEFDLRSDDDGQARVTVLGVGDVETRTLDYEGDKVGPLDSGMPSSPAPLPVSLTCLVDPFVELREDHSLSVGIDLRGATLINLGIDAGGPTPEGVDSDAWTGVLQMTSMMFAMMGDQLFTGLAEAVGLVGVDLGPEVGRLVAELGADTGPAEVRISSGVLSIGLAANSDTEGRAMPVPVAGKRFGVSVASSGVDRLVALIIERAAGGLPLPFEMDVSLGEQQVRSTLRQQRLAEWLPDLRSSVNTEIKVRLMRGQLEVMVSSAWIELPSVVPGFVNRFNRRLGSMLSLAPLRFGLPTTIHLPAGDDGSTIAVRVDDLRVGPDGLGVVLVIT